MKHLSKMACLLLVGFIASPAGAQLPSERPLNNQPPGVQLNARKAQGGTRPLPSEAPLPQAATHNKKKAAHDTARLEILPSESKKSVPELTRKAKADGARRRRN